MLRSLIGSRAGRRVIAVLVIAILVIASLAVYLQMYSGKNVNPSTKPDGSGYITGLPQSVNLTAVHSWTFPLQLVVTQSYLSGIILNITQNSTYSNAAAYFTTAGGSWQLKEGNLSSESTQSYYSAGNSDGNLTLVVQGNVNASGWIGISVRAVVGNVTPSFHEVNVFGYKSSEQPPPTPYIRFGDLPASVSVDSGAPGSYSISYATSGTTGGISWQTNQSWVSVANVDATHANATFTAPVVDVNTTYTVNITATSGNGVTNSSFLEINVLLPPAPSIALDNLPAELQVYPGEIGTFTVAYTATGISGPLQWSANESWLTVETVSGSAADANYTVPAVSENATFPVLIAVSTQQGATASSTLTFDVVVNQTSPPPTAAIVFENLPTALTVDSGSQGQYVVVYQATGTTGGISWQTNQSWVSVANVDATHANATFAAPVVDVNTTYTVNITATSGNGVTNSSTITFYVIAPTPEIILKNLPATLNVPANSSGTFAIQYEAIGVSGGLTWTSSLPWVTVTTVNSTVADANYTTPPVQPGFNCSTQDVQGNSTFVADIGVVSGNGVSNSSTITFVVTSPYRYNTTASVDTLISLNSSELEVYIDGGIHVNLFIPDGMNNASLLVYTAISLNNSRLSAYIDGGIHVNVYSGSATNLTIYTYTLLYLNNSTMKIRINGDVEVDAYSCSGIHVSVVSYTAVDSINSTIQISEGCTNVSVSSSPAQQQGPAQGQSYSPFFTGISLNHSELEIKIDGGIHIDFSTGQATSESVTAVHTYIGLNYSFLKVEICGGVYIDLVGYSQNQSVLDTCIQLSDTRAVVEIQKIVVANGCGQGGDDGHHHHDDGSYSQAAGYGQNAAESSSTMMKLTGHSYAAHADSSASAGCQSVGGGAYQGYGQGSTGSSHQSDGPPQSEST